MLHWCRIRLWWVDRFYIHPHRQSRCATSWPQWSLHRDAHLCGNEYAHHRCHRLLIAASGSVTDLVDDGKNVDRWHSTALTEACLSRHLLRAAKINSQAMQCCLCLRLTSMTVWTVSAITRYLSIKLEQLHNQYFRKSHP